jgi:DNA-binding MarR family transcriptional regulator
MSTPAEQRPKDPVDAIIEQWAEVRPDLDTAGMEVFGRVYRLARAMGDRMEKAYARYGISRGEFDVLATLRRSGEPYTLSPRQLSGTLMLTTGGMTGRLDKLERAGLLRRSTGADSRSRSPRRGCG